MNPPCPACLGTPSAIDGHADLSVLTIGSTMLTFECRRCRTRWSRTVSRGVFSWARIDEHQGRSVAMGATVPPRSNPFRERETSPTS